MADPLKSQDPGSDPGQGRVLARNSVFNILGNVLPLLAGLVAIPVVLEHLGKERFGILSLAWAVLIYISIFDLGLNRAIVKFMAELLGQGRRSEAPPVFWSALTIQAGLALIGTIGFILAVPVLTERILTISPLLLKETQDAFLVQAFFFPVMLLTLALRSVLEAAQRFDLINLIKIPATTGNFLIPLLGIALGLGLPGIFALMLAFRVVVILAYSFAVGRAVPELKGRPRVSREMIKRLVTFGGWLSVSNIIGPLFFYLESFFIGSLLSVEILAFYSPPFEVVSHFVIIPGAIAGALFPMIGSLASKGYQGLDRLVANSLKYILFLLTPLCLICVFFSGDILNLWLGAEFAANGAAILSLLAIVFFINSLAYVPLTVVLALGRPDLKAKLDLILLPLFVLLLWTVLPRTGVVGAAWVKMAVVLIDTLVLFLLARKVSRLGFRRLFSRDLIKTVLIGLGCTGLVLAAHYALSGLAARLFGAGSALALFGVVFLLLATDREERRSGLRLIGLGGRGD